MNRVLGRTPEDSDDPYPGDEDDCDHEDYEADILTGLATCTRCNTRWMQTPEEIARERQAQKDYDALCDEWEREGLPVGPIRETGDDIPF